MLKVIGLILIISSSTVLGFAYGEKFYKRVRELKEFQRAVYILKNEINFCHSLLPDALMKVYEKCDEPIRTIFKDIAMKLRGEEDVNVYSCFEEGINTNLSKLSLKEKDISIIMDLAKTLGEMDIDGHNDILGLAMEELGKAISEAEVNLEKNVKMYRYLGFSFGAMIGIILL